MLTEKTVIQSDDTINPDADCYHCMSCNIHCAICNGVEARPSLNRYFIKDLLLGLKFRYPTLHSHNITLKEEKPFLSIKAGEKWYGFFLQEKDFEQNPSVLIDSIEDSIKRIKEDAHETL